MLPIIFIFDLDSTLIGDSNPILDYYDLIQFIKNARISNKITIEQVSDLEFKSLPNWKTVLNPSIIRPYLKDFLQSLQTYFSNAEFFIYSAGETEYVRNMVKFIEKNIGIRFNRPLFSRTDCVLDETDHFSKSIITEFPKIIQSLSLIDKYSKLNLEKYTDDILKHSVLFIDDRNSLWDNKEKWLKCPSYNYKPIVELNVTLLQMIRHIPLIQEYLKSSGKNKKLYVDENKQSTDDEFYMGYHLFMANIYRDNLSENTKALQDDFFKHMIKLLKPYPMKKEPFHSKQILKLQHKLDSLVNK